MESDRPRADEAERLRALRAYGLTYTGPDPAFHALVRLAASVCEMPYAAVSVIETTRTLFRASFGFPAGLVEATRDFTFAERAANNAGILEIEDAMADPQFASNPFVIGEPHFRAYAAVPLIDRDGLLLGTLCALDGRPRTLTDAQREALRALAFPLVALIEARKGIPATSLEQAALVASALEHAPEPMALLTVGNPTTFSYVNRAFIELFGYGPAELLGLRPMRLAGAKTDLDKLARLRAATRDGVAGAETVYFYTASGDARLVEIRDRPLTASHRIFSVRDVTAVRAAHEALVEANARLTSLLENNNDAVFTVDAHGRCLDANAAAERLLDVPRASLAGLGFLDAVSDGFFPGQGLFPAALRAGRTLEFEAVYRIGGERERSVACTAVPMIVRGETQGAYIVAKDVTEAKRLADLVAERARRTHALYLIAASEGATDAQQIDAALELVLSTFDMQYAFLGRIDGETFHLLHVVGQGLVEVGDRFPVGMTRLQKTVQLGDVYAVNDISQAENAIDGVPSYPGWHGYISAPLVIDDRTYGAIGFCSTNLLSFNDADCDFVRLVAVLVASAMERQIQRKRLDELAYGDALTGLANRARCMADVEAAIARAQLDGTSFALHFIDLDDFKVVNDRAGHAVGDLVLKEVGRRLRAFPRPDGLPARLGGDEFVVLQPDLRHASEAEALATRVIATLSAPYAIEGDTFDVGASVGVAIYPHDGADASALLHHADTALYRAKAGGKRRVRLLRRS